MDRLVTGGIPMPSGTTVTIRHRKRIKDGFVTIRTIDANNLTATSSYFRSLFQDAFKSQFTTIDVTWPKKEPLELYLQWSQDRIVHRYPSRRRQSPDGKGSDEEAEAKRTEEDLSRNYNTLLSLWTFGNHISDSIFMDVVMTLMEEMFQAAENDVQAFFEALTPAVVSSVFQTESDFSKLQLFIMDAIAQSGTSNNIRVFIEANLENKNFVEGLNARLMLTAPLHILPAGLQPHHKKTLRILLPPPPYTKDMIGVEDRAFGDVGKTARYGGNLSGRQLQLLGQWVVGQEESRCKYHVHGKASICWLPQ